MLLLSNAMNETSYSIQYYITIEAMPNIFPFKWWMCVLQYENRWDFPRTNHIQPPVHQCIGYVRSNERMPSHRAVRLDLIRANKFDSFDCVSTCSCSVCTRYLLLWSINGLKFHIQLSVWHRVLPPAMASPSFTQFIDNLIHLITTSCRQ